MKENIFLSDSMNESRSPFIRLPLLLFVVEGMLEVGGSQLNALQKNDTVSVVERGIEPSEKIQHAVQVLLEQRVFVEFAMKECEEWKKSSLGAKHLYSKLKKLDAALKELDALHDKLLHSFKIDTSIPLMLF